MQLPPAEEPSFSSDTPGAAPASAPGSRPHKPEPGHVALTYHVDAGALGCDDEELFRRWTAVDFEGDPFVVKGAVEHTLRLAFSREGDKFLGVLELRDSAGALLLHRDTRQPTCHGAADWIELYLVVHVFPFREAKRRPDPECPACVEEIREKQDEQQRALEGATREIVRLGAEVKRLREEASGREKHMDLTYALSTGVLITANLTPNVGPGVWLGGELRAGPLSLGLEFRAALPSNVPVGPFDFDFSEYVGMLVPCGRYSYFFGCGVAAVGSQLYYDSNRPLGGTNSRAYELFQFGGRIGAEVPFADNRLAVRGWGEVLYSTPGTGKGYAPVEGTTGPVYKWDRPDVSAFFGVGLVVKFGNKELR